MASIHLIIASLTGLIVLYADEQAAVWLLGKREFFHPGTMQFLHRAVSLGLALLLITGGILYYQAPPAYLSLGTFDVKMVMVFAIICNTYFINRFSQVAVARSFESLSRRERLPLYISGAISFLGWVTAFVCGLLIS
jgi:hypothetical protein